MKRTTIRTISIIVAVLLIISLLYSMVASFV